MKKLLFSSIVLLASLSSFADRGATKLTISSNNKKNLTIMVDGYARNNNYDNSITISDLYGGSHNVKIYEEVRTGFFGRKSTRTLYDGNLFLRANYETSVVIRW